MSQRYKPVLTESGLILRMWRSCKSMSMWRARGVGGCVGQSGWLRETGRAEAWGSRGGCGKRGGRMRGVAREG